MNPGESGPRRLVYIYLRNDVVTTSFVTDRHRAATLRRGKASLVVFGDLDLGRRAFSAGTRVGERRERERESEFFFKQYFF